MRTAFIETLCELAEQNERIWLLTGDLGFSVLERFAQRFPQRYVNMGVAEQNMTGVAAGLALEGKIVFTYSIANFPSMRCLEQVRNDICYHNLNVKIVSVGSGLIYGAAGYTHHAVEDLAVMSALPNMTIVVPADPTEVRAITRAITGQAGPCYLSLGKTDEAQIYPETIQFTPGRMIEVYEDHDALLIATGNMVSVGADVVAQARAKGLYMALWSCSWLKPIDRAAIETAAGHFPLIVTLEEARAPGVLGSTAARILAAIPSPRAHLLCLDLTENVLSAAFSQKSARASLGVDAEQVLQRILAAMAA